MLKSVRWAWPERTQEVWWASNTVFDPTWDLLRRIIRNQAEKLELLHWFWSLTLLIQQDVVWLDISEKTQDTHFNICHDLNKEKTFLNVPVSISWLHRAAEASFWRELFHVWRAGDSCRTSEHSWFNYATPPAEWCYYQLLTWWRRMKNHVVCAERRKDLPPSQRTNFTSLGTVAAVLLGNHRPFFLQLVQQNNCVVFSCQKLPGWNKTVALSWITAREQDGRKTCRSKRTQWCSVT